MVSDSLVRNYTGVDEFKKHAGKQTDYLGNLADGRWVRFEPTGINLLGETHTKVSLDKVLPVVGSTSFIYEPFAADTLTAGSNIKTAYAHGGPTETIHGEFGALQFEVTPHKPNGEAGKPVTGSWNQLTNKDSIPNLVIALTTRLRW